MSHKMSAIRTMVKAKGLATDRRATKVTLIRMLQKSEDNFDCYATAIDGFCDQTACVWMEDCIKASKSNKA
jgi:hypothetical protein